jgi:serine/threonine-protein kinase
MDDAHGNYVIKPIRRIGKGGFGYVEEVQLQNYQGHVCGTYARKVFAPQDPAYRDEFIRRFERRSRTKLTANILILCRSTFIT